MASKVSVRGTIAPVEQRWQPLDGYKNTNYPAEMPSNLFRVVGKTTSEMLDHTITSTHNAIQDAMNHTTQIVATATSAVMAPVETATNMVVDTTVGVVDAGKRIGTQAAGIVAKPVNSTVNQVKFGMDRIKEGSIGGVLGGAASIGIGTPFAAAGGLLRGLWGTAKTTVSQGVFRPIGATFRHGGTMLGNIFGRAGTAVATVPSLVLDPIKSVGRGVLGFAGAIGNGFRETVESVAHAFIPWGYGGRPERRSYSDYSKQAKSSEPFWKRFS